MEALIKVPGVSSERDIRSLRKLVDSIDSNVRSLKTLGIDFKQYGSLLIPMVVGKIPEEIRLEITKNMGKDNWGLELVLDIMRSEIEARERGDQIGIAKASTVKQIRPSSYTTASALFSDGGRVT